MVYNIFTCSGFEAEMAGWVASIPCLAGRAGFVLLFFIIAIIRKWGGEEMGLEFNFGMSLAGALLTYFLLITFTGNFKVSFLIGLVAALVGGYGSGYIFGGSE